VNLELHGIDLLDPSDGLEALVRRQPALARPAGEKLASLHAVVEMLRAEGYAFVTLAEEAELRARRGWERTASGVP
jgi:hypothetical protein